MRRRYATVLPVDMGIRKLATTIEDGKPNFYGKQVRTMRGHHFHLRRSVGKPSVIKKWRHAEQVSVKHEVHAITRRIVEQAKRANALIVIGDLEGIRGAGSWKKLQSPPIKPTVLPVQAAIDLQGELGRNPRATGFGSVYFTDIPPVWGEGTSCRWKILMP